MVRRSLVIAGCVFSFSVSLAYGNPDGARMSGDFRILGTGNGIVFPDNSVQTTAALQGPPNVLVTGTVTTGAPGSSASATITGTSPAQTLNLVIPQGPAGVAGPTGPAGPPGTSGVCTSIKYLWSHMTLLTTYPATQATSAYNTTADIRNMYDTQGKPTGWIQHVNAGTNTGASSASSSAAYYTAFDTHNGATDGYVVTTPNTTFRITQSYTYDGQGNRTQRVRTWYNPDGSTFRVQTTNYGTHNTYLSETSVTNGQTLTTTYSDTQYDANGYPFQANFTATNTVGGVVSTGVVLYEFTPVCM